MGVGLYWVWGGFEFRIKDCRGFRDGHKSERVSFGDRQGRTVCSDSVHGERVEEGNMMLREGDDRIIWRYSVAL